MAKSARFLATSLISLDILNEVQAQNHSVSTFSMPRNRNCLNFIRVLIMPLGDSQIQQRLRELRRKAGWGGPEQYRNQG